MFPYAFALDLRRMSRLLIHCGPNDSPVANYVDAAIDQDAEVAVLIQQCDVASVLSLIGLQEYNSFAGCVHDAKLASVLTSTSGGSEGSSLVPQADLSAIVILIDLGDGRLISVNKTYLTSLGVKSKRNVLTRVKNGDFTEIFTGGQYDTVRRGVAYESRPTIASNC